jgi:hypothetical protein
MPNPDDAPTLRDDEEPLEDEMPADEPLSDDEDEAGDPT